MGNLSNDLSHSVELGFIDHLDKLIEVNINPDHLGNDNEDYHLSRPDDESPYRKDTCRFVKKQINMMEQIANGRNRFIN